MWVSPGGPGSRPGLCGPNQAVSRSGSFEAPKCWWNQRAPARRRRHHADRLVVDALDLALLAVLPRRDAQALRPRVGVALALEADQHRRRSVRVRLGIAAVLVLPDPQIEHVAGHERLDTAEAGRAAVVERQVAVDDVGNEIGAAHGEPAHRVGLDVVLVLVEVVGAAEAIAELERAVEDRVGVVDQVHQVGRGGAGEQQRRARARIDDAMPGIHRDREQRARLPFEHVTRGCRPRARPRSSRGLRPRRRSPRTGASRH